VCSLLESTAGEKIHEGAGVVRIYTASREKKFKEWVVVQKLSGTRVYYVDGGNFHTFSYRTYPTLVDMGNFLTFYYPSTWAYF